MVRYLRATTAEGGGWDREANYRDIGWGAKGTVGKTYSMRRIAPYVFARFMRPPEFQYLRMPCEERSLWTNGISGCAAVAYFYWKDGRIDCVALGHVNCGDFEKPSLGPFSGASARGYVGFDTVDVVVAHGSDGDYGSTHRYVTQDGVEDDRVFDYEDPLLEDFIVTMDGKMGRIGTATEAAPIIAPVVAGKKRKCFLTSATCETLGLGDDCAELETLRWFRDAVLARSGQGRREIEAYGRIAPGLVELIDRRADRSAVYRHLFHTLVRPAVAEIRDGRYDAAHRRYRGAVMHLLRRFPARP